MERTYLLLYEEGGVIQDYDIFTDKDKLKARKDEWTDNEANDNVGYVFTISHDGPIVVSWE